MHPRRFWPGLAGLRRYSVLRSPAGGQGGGMPAMRGVVVEAPVRDALMAVRHEAERNLLRNGWPPSGASLGGSAMER